MESALEVPDRDDASDSSGYFDDFGYDDSGHYSDDDDFDDGIDSSGVLYDRRAADAARSVDNEIASTAISMLGVPGAESGAVCYRSRGGRRSAGAVPLSSAVGGSDDDYDDDDLESGAGAKSD